MSDDAFPRLPPREAVEYLRGKGYKIGFAWQDVWQEEHARAFTVAKAMSRDLLETIRAAVDKALANGETLEQFRAELTPVLQAKGWWGRKSMIDPATGMARTVQLGSPRRLRIIYETNLRMAQAAGRWDQIQRTKKHLPFLRYTAVMDDRTRPEHREWHGTILPVDDPWWDTHYPPCGWNCRCTTIQLDQATIDERGWRVDDAPPSADPPRPWTNPRTGEVIDVPAGIDPGFAYNPGKTWLDGIEPSLMPEPLDAGVEPGRGGAAIVPGPPAIAPEASAPRPAPERAPTGVSSPVVPTLRDVPGLLPPGVTEAEAVDAFVAEATEVKPVVTLTGDELAPFDAPIEDLRAEARAWLMARRGEPVATSALGPVPFTKDGIKEAIARSAKAHGGELKLRVTPAVAEVLAQGEVRYEPNHKPDTQPFVTGYAYFRAPVNIAGEIVSVEVTVERQGARVRYYDHNVVEARSGRPIKPGGVSGGGGQGAVAGLAAPESGGRSAVDIAGRAGGVEGRILIDQAGWPLPIGPGWFRNIGGAPVVPLGDRRRVLGLVGRALRQAREIRQRWVTAANGEAMLMRRYIARFGAVDVVVEVGRAGWRFATSLDAGFDLAALVTGDLVWSVP